MERSRTARPTSSCYRTSEEEDEEEEEDGGGSPFHAVLPTIETELPPPFVGHHAGLAGGADEEITGYLADGEGSSSILGAQHAGEEVDGWGGGEGLAYEEHEGVVFGQGFEMEGEDGGAYLGWTA